MTIAQARRLQALSRWHRRIALVIMAWLLFLALSGFLLNHANDWGLDREPLAGPLQGWLYGIEHDAADYCGDYPAVGQDCRGIFAALEIPDGRLLLAGHALFLLDASGQLLEQLPVGQAGLDGLEAGLVRDAVVYLRGAGKTVRSDPGLLDFLVLGGPEAALLDQADWRYATGTDAISWERFLLDLHAARFLGPFTKTFNDIVALMVLLLAASGFWMHRIKSRSNGSGMS